MCVAMCCSIHAHMISSHLRCTTTLPVCCSVLQCAAVCSSMLQLLVRCSVLQYTHTHDLFTRALRRNLTCVLHCAVAVCYSVLQCVAVRCSALQCAAVISTLQCVAMSLQYIAVYMHARPPHTCAAPRLYLCAAVCCRVL